VSSSIKVASLQLPTLPLSDAKLDYYLQMCTHKDVKIVVISEYVINSFFKELEKMPLKMIKEQSKRKIEALRAFSKRYNLIIIAPIIIIKKALAYKVIAKFSPKSTSYHYQKYLINYPHWNEDKFFSNDEIEEDSGLFFKVDGIKFAAICGFEMHFDELWLNMLAKRVDAVLVPMVGTFDSKKRWRELAKTRAFLNGMYVLTVNRVGDFKDKKHSWKFYGNSLAVNPYGEIESILGEKEEVFIVEIDKKMASESKKSWGFRGQLERRGKI